MLSIPAFVVVALATYRLARFVAADTLTVPAREVLYRFAYDDTVSTPRPRAAWRTYAYDLVTCQWCLGVWFAAGTYCAWRWGGDVVRAVIVVVAVAGLQGFLASRGES